MAFTQNYINRLIFFNSLLIKGNLVLVTCFSFFFLSILTFLFFICFQFLYLEGNAISALPEELFDCLPNLRWLDLRNNRISEIPPIIGKHRFDSHSLVILFSSNWLEQIKSRKLLVIFVSECSTYKFSKNVSSIDHDFLFQQKFEKYVA